MPLAVVKVVAKPPNSHHTSNAIAISEWMPVAIRPL